MSVSLGRNISSLKAQRQLALSSAELQTTFERLSSGQRINHAADDAAGLSVASALSTKRRVFTQGIRNLNDGVSLLNIADGAIEQLSAIGIRLKELAEQAANGTYGVKQRRAIDTEAQQLSKEYFRIARSTTFNGQGVFFAEFGDLRLQAGYGTTGGISSGLGGAIGLGTFSSTSTFTTIASGSVALDVAVGDLNGDGFADLVGVGIEDGGSGFLSVSLGAGDGTFKSTTTTIDSTMQQIFTVSLGDVNGDGILDVLSGGQDASPHGVASVRLGRGDGTFGTAISYQTSSAFLSNISAQDLNGDGRLDLITSQGGSEVQVRMGQGNGTFGAIATYTMDNVTDLTDPFSGAALGDLNGDGLLDIISTGYLAGTGGGIGVVRFGNADGTFRASTSFTTVVPLATATELGDFNNDGQLDVLISGSDGSDGVVSIALGNGNGTFKAAISYAADADTRYTLATGDLNGDGNLDFATSGFDGNGAYSSVTQVFLGKGDGTFADAVTYDDAQITTVINLATGDFNGDGVLELVSAAFDEVAQVSQIGLRNATTTSGVSPLLPFSLKTRADALQALPEFDRVLNRLSTQRGTIGAFQSRITVAQNTLQASADNFAAAEGRIKDADVADGASRLIRTGILQQAASAVLAQANQQPALALQLLA